MTRSDEALKCLAMQIANSTVTTYAKRMGMPIERYPILLTETYSEALKHMRKAC